MRTKRAEHPGNHWNPGEFMMELFKYYDANASTPNYCVLSSGINLFPMTEAWKRLIRLEIDYGLSYPLYTTPFGFPCGWKSITMRENFSATEGRVDTDQFGHTVCMTIGAAQAVAIVFEYLAKQYQAPSVLLLGLNHPLFGQLAQHHHMTLYEIIGQGKDASATLPLAKIVEQEIVQKKPSVVVIVQPNNPSGEVYTEEDLTQIFFAAKCSGSLLLIDQVGQLPISFDSWINVNKIILSTQVQSQALIVQSFSKTDSIPGFRIGYLAVPSHMVEFVAHYQQLMIMNPQTTPVLPIFLTSLARCLFLGERMNWIHEEGKLHLTRYFYGVFKMSSGDLPPAVSQEFSPLSLRNLSNDYIAEQLKNYASIQSNQKYIFERLDRYISQKTDFKGGFNCMIKLDPFLGRDEFEVCQELFRATGIAILSESSFRVYTSEQNENFWIRVSLAVPEEAFQQSVSKLEAFLEQQSSTRREHIVK